MIKVNFIDHHKQISAVEAELGTTLMQAAVDNGIPGVIAECGGFCSCATCICYVDAEWVEHLNPASDMEHAMLESAAEEKPNCRLSCQITLTKNMDGLTVHLPESQY